MGDNMKYVKRTCEGILVIDKRAKHYNLGLKQYINQLCIENFSTFDGREQASKAHLKVSSNLPIYVNENLILFPTKSRRNYDCVYVNYHKILSLKDCKNGLSKVIFDDLTEIELETNYSKLSTLYQRANLIFKLKLSS